MCHVAHIQKFVRKSLILPGGAGASPRGQASQREGQQSTTPQLLTRKNTLGSLPPIPSCSSPVFLFSSTVPPLPPRGRLINISTSLGPLKVRSRRRRAIFTLFDVGFASVVQMHKICTALYVAESTAESHTSTNGGCAKAMTLRTIGNRRVSS